MQILNYVFIFYFVLLFFFPYLFPSLENQKIGGKEKMHTDLLLRYINVGEVNQDSLEA